MIVQVDIECPYDPKKIRRLERTLASGDDVIVMSHVFQTAQESKWIPRGHLLISIVHLLLNDLVIQ